MDFKKIYSKPQKEAIRLAKKYREQVPEVNLELFVSLLKEAGLPEIETIAKSYFLENPEFCKYLLQLKTFLEKQPPSYLKKLYDFLTPENRINSNRASVIFIYGTKHSLARASLGVEIYKKYNLPVIISDKECSGWYKQFLIKKRIPNNKIFEEKQGRDYIENAYYSIKLASENNISLRGIILITASLVSLRALLMTKIFLKPNSILYSCPVHIDPTNPLGDPTSPEEWYKNEKGIKIFLSEIVKLYLLVKENLLKQV
jgi:hypothetical protein